MLKIDKCHWQTKKDFEIEANQQICSVAAVFLGLLTVDFLLDGAHTENPSIKSEHLLYHSGLKQTLTGALTPQGCLHYLEHFLVRAVHELLVCTNSDLRILLGGAIQLQQHRPLKGRKLLSVTNVRHPLTFSPLNFHLNSSWINYHFIHFTVFFFKYKKHLCLFFPLQIKQKMLHVHDNNQSLFHLSFFHLTSAEQGKRLKAWTAASLNSGPVECPSTQWVSRGMKVEASTPVFPTDFSAWRSCWATT